MTIKEAKFLKGITEEDRILEVNFPQIAFIGRSNVGKSSIINTLTMQKNLARTSSMPGRTQEINIFLVNKNAYFVDLPGYGYAKMSLANQKRIQYLINWYLFQSPYSQKAVVFIIDANIGITANDSEMLLALAENKKNIIIVANKVDKIKNSELHKKLQQIQQMVGAHQVIPFSSEKRIGIKELTNAIL